MDYYIVSDVAYIPLRNKQGIAKAWAKVDKEDVEKVFKTVRTWSLSQGKYAIGRCNIRSKKIRMHRLIMDVVDHKYPKDWQIDHMAPEHTLDNRKSNLRIVNNQENSFNTRIGCNNSSGFKGVSKHSYGHKWAAQIQIDGKNKYLGLFNTPEEAYETYCEAAKKLHGEYWHG